MGIYLRTLLLPALLTGTVPALFAQQQEGAVPGNIIIMISDGCGFNHILATDYYLHGKAGSEAFESFPVRLAMSTFPARTSDTGLMVDPAAGYVPDSAWDDFDYFKRGWTDSAPAATTLATGVKTYNGAIGVDVNHRPLYNITQRAADLGKAAGVVTTVPLSHATPAGFVAHNTRRDNYAEIAREMILDSRLNVIMGCGHPHFSNDANPLAAGAEYKYVGGKLAWDSLVSGAVTFSEPSLSGNATVADIDRDGRPDPWTLISDLASFKALQEGSTPLRVIGIPAVRSTLQEERSGKMDTLPFAEPFLAGLPSLKEMALGALNVLDNDPDGFFLMIEGGAPDWASHDHLGGRMIEEQQSFHEAVGAVTGWIEANGGWEKNLLVVTSDHECGYLTGPGFRDPSPVTNPVINHGQGKMPGMRFNSGDHTNQLVPFFAKGPGAAFYLEAAIGNDPFRGKYIDNTEVNRVFFRLWPLP